MRHVYHIVADHICDGPIPIVNANGMFASEAGNLMAIASPAKMGIVWTLQKYGLKLMLRSVEGGPDVAQLARDLWGGGGHKHAAGALIKDPTAIKEMLCLFASRS